nr:PREDICTED: 1-phosphatidylinositol 4,5-bisphosphate phosphodiesterase eta-2 [Latimeria chalumnae]|eukprot:XP_014344178.1 PREDICTED: 1-phosphatidylinositol 4,5-bisphosphate phosphodiesterase eta-2 [Latimeria chalumnae]
MAQTSPRIRSGSHGLPKVPVPANQPSKHFLFSNFINIVERCMSCMQSGTQMVKLRGGSKGLVRFYYLDDHKSCIRWRPSRKNEKAKISIDVIREVCEGKQSEIFQRYADGSFDPNCCFSIYYGDHMESLDLVSSNGEEARTWITGLKYLMAGISDEDSLSKRQRTRDQWLKQTFSEADKNGDGSLSISEVLQLMHKLNVNLPRQKVKQMFKEADTDDNQGTLGFEEFCAFYKMMSTRRDLYLLLLTYSNHKEHLDTDDIIRFLEIEQKMIDVTKEHCLEIINKFEPCPENQKERVLGIDGFTNYMRSPAGDIFNPEHYQVNQDMTQPLCNYYIASSHNTYLMGDQLMSQSRVDMYAWVLQAGCRCVEVDCWDGPDGEPIVHHGYTLTSKILFRDVIETINKYAFVKNEYPIILSIENHCSVPQQKKMAQYLVEVLGDKLDLSSVNNDDSSKFPSPKSLKSKILVKGKKLPANISADAEEGDVSDEDSADEIDDDCKLMNGDASVNRKLVENVAKKKLDSLLRESKIRDREDPNNFTVTALPTASKLPQKPELKKKSASVAGTMMEKHVSKIEEQGDPVEEPSMNVSKRHSRSLMGSFSKRKKKMVKVKKASSLEMDDEETDQQGNTGRSAVHYSRISRQKKTMKLSRALSDLVKYTKSVGTHDVDTEVSYSWQVSSFSETKAHQILQQKPNQFIRFNQHQLSRIYPSSYRVDSSNYNPQPFWNAGCQLVALNYQSEGRVLQLNRAKFSTNGNCGYVLKPKCMCQGAFNPISEDPLPGQLKKQLVLRLISGQQLPKPRDSMLGDRGEVGFNPMWEETLVFTLHMPEIALVRFLVWDHDPIGRDFIGQRTIAFSSMIPGYRHVYLEGMEEASIFVHIAVNDITGKARQVMGLKGLFLRNPKQASLDSHAAVQLNRKHSFSSHLLRRTASAPTKGQQKSKKGFPEIAINAKDNSSEGASEERESEDSSQPRFDKDPESGASGPAPRDGANGEVHDNVSKGKTTTHCKGKGVTHAPRGEAFTEPMRRANRACLQENLDEKQGVFARCAINGSGRIGVASNCMKCVIGCKESPDLERKWNDHGANRPLSKEVPSPSQSSNVKKNEWLELQSLVVTGQPKQRSDYQSCSRNGNTNIVSRSIQSTITTGTNCGDPKGHWGKGQPKQRWQCQSDSNYGSTVNLVTACSGSLSSSSSSLEALGSPELSHRWAENSRRQVGTLQREMNALFLQKMEEIRSKSPIFFTDVHISSLQRKVSSMQSLETIFEESVIVKEKASTVSSHPPPLPAATNSVEGSLPSPSNPQSLSEEELELVSNDPLNEAEKAHFTSDPERNSLAHKDQASHTAAAIMEGDEDDKSQDGIPKGELKETGSCGPSEEGEIEALDSENCSKTTKAVPDPVAISVRFNGPFQENNGKTDCAVVNGRTGQHFTTVDSDVTVGPEQLNNQQNTAGAVSTVNVPQTAEAFKAYFGQQNAVSHACPHPLVRRAKSEGHVVPDHSALSTSRVCQSPAAEVYSDVTNNDRIWSKLDNSNHRDSMSSSSSMSSNDTVIDLSLPNLARKSLTDLDSSQNEAMEGFLVDNGIRPRASTSGCEMQRVSKSKSNPNLRSSPEPPSEGHLRPLDKGPEGVSQSIARRHTWNRLYIEGLKKSSPTLKTMAQENKSGASPSKSKSLGDLTSDDIMCNFEGKYKSISRSFVTRSMREQRRPTRVATAAKSQDDLTAQLKRLTSFEEANDITSPTHFTPIEAEEEGFVMLRRSSSRSQSRVRYIANRAKQAQERQRLQQLAQMASNPIEERGNPEGACTVTKGICIDSVPSNRSKTEAEVFFMLKL